MYVLHSWYLHIIKWKIFPVLCCYFIYAIPSRSTHHDHLGHVLLVSNGIYGTILSSATLSWIRIAGERIDDAKVRVYVLTCKVSLISVEYASRCKNGGWHENSRTRKIPSKRSIPHVIRELASICIASICIFCTINDDAMTFKGEFFRVLYLVILHCNFKTRKWLNSCWLTAKVTVKELRIRRVLLRKYAQ